MKRLMIAALVWAGCQDPSAGSGALVDAGAARDGGVAEAGVRDAGGGAVVRPALLGVEGEGKDAQEVRGLQAQLEKLPEHGDSWARLGELWVRLARERQDERLYERADDAAGRALELRPGDMNALRVRGLVARERHDFRGLRELGLRMTASAPKDPGAWGLLGDAALELGDYKAAEEAYQRMIDLRPALPSFSRVAWLRWLHGDVEGALEMWGEAAKAGGVNDPEPLAFCLVEAGHLEWHRGKLDAAVMKYEEALAVMPGHAGALFGRGRARVGKGEFGGAVEDLEGSLRVRRLEETYLWLMEAKRLAGRGAEADEMEARLLRGGALDDPRTVSVWLSVRGKEPERAWDLACKDAEQRGDVYTLDALALGAWRRGKLEEAVGLVERMLSLGTPDARLLAHGGLILVEAGKGDLGRPLLEKALAMNPHFDPALVGRVREVLGQGAGQGGKP